MNLMWLKRFILCSVTFTGGYITFWPRNIFLKYLQNKEENQNGSDDSSSFIYLPNNIEYDFGESVESSWNFMRRMDLPIYWKLFRLCKSKNMKVRHKAIDALSKSSLEKWQYFSVAQACDIDTSIGLARSLHSSPDFFLPPPFKDLKEGNLQRELYNLLSSLPSSSHDSCTKDMVKKVQKSAEPLFKHDYNWNLEVGDPSVIYHSQQKTKSVFLFDKLCLETILACSVNSSLRNLMMEKGILKVLLKVWNAHLSDIHIHSLIAQILANFALEEKFRKDIYMTGWIGILAKWIKSPYVNVNLPAAKTLANLDNDDLSHPIYDDSVFIVHPLCKLSQKNVFADVVFIHGLLGATFWTWRQRGCPRIGKSVNDSTDINDMPNITKYSMCWPKDWLATDIPFLRLVSVDYKTCLSSWFSNCVHDGKEKDIIDKRAKEIMHKLLLSNVGERPIIWIAHSMGGLIVKKILTESLQSKDEEIKLFANKTAGLVFYSVPHKGSETARRITSASIILFPSQDVTELQKGSPNLLSLHKDFEDFVSKNDIPVLSFGEAEKTHWGFSSTILVPSDTADPGFGEFYTLSTNHLNTCKPESQSSSDYLKVLHFVQGLIFKILSSQTHQRKRVDQIFEVAKMLCLIP